MTAPQPEAESRFRLMADVAPMMVWIANASQGCDWFNAGWLRFTGRALAQEVGFGWAEGVHPDDRERCLTLYRSAFESREPFSIEYRLRRHDGAWRWILDKGAPRYEADGEFRGYVGACVDTQQGHDSEATLAAMLRDREVLLREVHHRVRNNFQLVMSMIGLRYSQLEAQSPAGVVLRELKARVGVMAAIQEELVSQPHADRIDFAGQLRRLVVSMHEGEGIEVATDIEALEVPVNLALTLGLIATELLSNIYKHAFHGRPGQGRLWITLRSAGEHVVLTMRDNGPGIPPPHARPRSIGLQIVQALVEQAEGEVDVDTAPGSTVEVRMKALA